MLDKITAHMQKSGTAHLAMQYEEGEWTVSYNYGDIHNPDTPVTGAHSIGSSLEEALARVAEEL
jgi:hypothetical protein